MSHPQQSVHSWLMVLGAHLSLLSSRPSKPSYSSAGSDLAGARTQLEEALRISEPAFGPDHPNVESIRNALRQLPEV